MASAEEKGQLLIELADLEENKIKEVFRFHTNLVSQATKSPAGANAQALPTIPGTPYQGKRLIVSMIPDATDIIESEECDWTIPVNFIDERSGQVTFTKDVALENFTGFKPSGSIDITLTAATKGRVAYLDAPVGYRLTLGAGRKYHAYIGDDTV